MLTDLLNNLKEKNIFLWIKTVDQLGFSFDKDIDFDADLKAKMVARKLGWLRWISTDCSARCKTICGVTPFCDNRSIVR